MDDGLLWDIRAFVYQHFAETTRAAPVEEVAARFNLSHEEVIAAYEELHQRHAMFLQPGTHEILMANPFSGVETQFKVHGNDKTYFANCAWDSLGIPAALQMNAVVEAECAQSREPIRLKVKDQQIQSSDALVHFLLPFRDWYNDLTFT